MRQTVIQRSGKLGVAVLSPDVVDFEQAEREPLSNGQVHAAAHDGSDAAASVQAVDRHTVQADQSVQEVICAIRTPDETRSYRYGRFVVAAPPVMTEVKLGTPMRVKVVSEGAAEPRRHIRNLEGSGIVEIAERRRHRAAGMQPLVSRKQIPLGVRVALRERSARNE